MTRQARDDKSGPNPGPTEKPQRIARPLTAQQVKAIAAIARGAFYVDAAKEAGVDQATLWRWRTENADFAAALDEVLGSMREAAAAGLVASADVAMRRLRSLAEHAEDEAIGLKAATEILNRIDGAVQKGSTGAQEAAVTVQVLASDAAAELRRRKEQGE